MRSALDRRPGKLAANADEAEDEYLVQRAEIQFHEAAEALRAAVGCFWVVTAERGAVLRVVPDGSTAISIGFQTDQTAEWSLRGPLIRPDERRFSGPAVLIAIRLRPGFAFLLSGISAHTIVGRRVALGGLAAFRDLVSAELHPHTPGRCIDVLQRFLLQRLEHASLHHTVATALREIEREHGGVRVPELASSRPKSRNCASRKAKSSTKIRK